MNAIRLKKHLDSDTLYLPEIKDLIGKDVIVIEEISSALTKAERIKKFLESAGTIDVDEQAIKDLDDASMI